MRGEDCCSSHAPAPATAAPSSSESTRFLRSWPFGRLLIFGIVVPATFVPDPSSSASIAWRIQFFCFAKLASVLLSSHPSLSSLYHASSIKTAR